MGRTDSREPGGRFGYPLVHGLIHFSQRLPSYVQAAEHGHGWIDHLVRRFHPQAWIVRNAPKLQSLDATLARRALNVGKGACRCWPRWARSSPFWCCSCSKAQDEPVAA